MAPKHRALTVPDTEFTDEELALVMREARALAARFLNESMDFEQRLLDPP